MSDKAICNMTYSEISGVSTGILIRQLIWIPLMIFFMFVFFQRSRPYIGRKKKRNSVEQCNAICLCVAFLNALYQIDLMGYQGFTPYVVDALLINMQVAMLLSLLFTIVNSWVAVMSTKGTRAMVPPKWKIARAFATVTVILNGLIVPLIEAPLGEYPFKQWFGKSFFAVQNPTSRFPFASCT